MPFCPSCGKRRTQYNKGPLCYTCSESIDEWDELTFLPSGTPPRDVYKQYKPPRKGDTCHTYVRRLILSNTGYYVPLTQVCRGYGFTKLQTDAAISTLKKWLGRRGMYLQKSPEARNGYMLCYTSGTRKPKLEVLLRELSATT